MRFPNVVRGVKIKSGNFSWMKCCEDSKSKSVNNMMKSAERLYKNIAIKGKTRKAFEGYK